MKISSAIFTLISLISAISAQGQVFEQNNISLSQIHSANSLIFKLDPELIYQHQNDYNCGYFFGSSANYETLISMLNFAPCGTDHNQQIVERYSYPHFGLRQQPSIPQYIKKWTLHKAYNSGRYLEPYLSGFSVEFWLRYSHDGMSKTNIVIGEVNNPNFFFRVENECSEIGFLYPEINRLDFTCQDIGNKLTDG